MEAPVKPDKTGFLLNFLYGNPIGRLLLKSFNNAAFSKIAGSFMDSPISKIFIRSFIKNNKISTDDLQQTDFSCFNDCFSRKMKNSARPVDMSKEAFISPCDGLLSAYRIKKNLVIPVKQSFFSIKSLLSGNKIYEEYKEGICLVFRLCVNHYHRYCYVDNGIKGNNHFIKGKLHTVRPVALYEFPVFCENCREYTIIYTENFGKIIQMEVGAMLVGKIVNYHNKKRIKKGTEKGKFLYGGSTIILLVKKDAVKFPEIFFGATRAGYEIPVKLGEKIGVKQN